MSLIVLLCYTLVNSRGCALTIQAPGKSLECYLFVAFEYTASFAPLGPVLAAGFDWSRGRIETKLNGSVVQSGHFSELLFDPNVIVSYVSRYMTLYPGDVIYTGTPGQTDSLKPGDLVEVDIPGIGILRNTVSD